METGNKLLRGREGMGCVRGGPNRLLSFSLSPSDSSLQGESMPPLFSISLSPFPLIPTPAVEIQMHQQLPILVLKSVRGGRQQAE